MIQKSGRFTANSCDQLSNAHGNLLHKEVIRGPN
jgi:hypothetical protein